MVDVLVSAEGQLPLLETLWLAGTPATNSLEAVQTNFFETAPRLCAVTWTLFLSRMDQFKFPWKQLTTVGLLIEDFYLALKIAGRCPDIVVLNLAIAPQDDDPLPPPPLPETQLHRLTSLSLRCHSEPGSFFTALTLPALESLKIDYTHFANETEVEISRFLIRSGCQLKKLRVVGRPDGPIINDDMLHLFQQAPSIMELDLRQPSFHCDCTTQCVCHLTSTTSPAHMSKLVVKNGQPVILPHLRRLRITYAAGSDVSDRAFIDMIKSRWELPHGSQAAQIKRVDLLFSEIQGAFLPLNGSVARALRGYAEDGLIITDNLGIF
jgi:hypothetical protein